jgi:PBP1b-binding outer membrane lipoprotein LpoB
MIRFVALLMLALIVAGCSPDSEPAASVNKCATELFPAFNPKIMDQCVAVCKKCDHGTPATCTTSCTLKGAR